VFAFEFEFEEYEIGVGIRSVFVFKFDSKCSKAWIKSESLVSEELFVIMRSIKLSSISSESLRIM
jgi:hypothetical protein